MLCLKINIYTNICKNIFVKFYSEIHSIIFWKLCYECKSSIEEIMTRFVILLMHWFILQSLFFKGIHNS